MSILELRALVEYVRSSLGRLKKFKEFKKEDVEKSKSCLDIEKYGNSTYLILKSVVKFKKSFISLSI